MLGRVVVDELDGGVEVRGEHDPAVLGERAGEDVAAVGRRQQRADLALDRVGEGRVGRDEDRRGVGAVLGLGQQVQGHAAGLGRRRGEDEALGRARRQVDADLAADLDLGGGHPGVAGSDDPVDRLEAGVGQAVGERADRLGATGDDEGIDLEQAGDAEQDGVRDAVAVGRAGDDDATRPRPRAPGPRS